MPKKLDLVGQRFGRLTVVEYVKLEKHRKWWKCQCDCGKTLTVRTDQLRTGNTASCGCNRKGKRKPIHGEGNSRLYRIWKGMKSRCYCKGSTSYKWYGALGIQVCEEWQKYEPFRDWAHTNGYTDELTIERIDVYGNYEPSNCTWITRAEQNANMRKSKTNRETER